MNVHGAADRQGEGGGTAGERRRQIGRGVDRSLKVAFGNARPHCISCGMIRTTHQIRPRRRIRRPGRADGGKKGGNDKKYRHQIEKKVYEEGKGAGCGS